MTAAVSRTLSDARFRMSRKGVLEITSGKTIEGWELDYFLAKALKRKKYHGLKEVISDLEDWLDLQG